MRKRLIAACAAVAVCSGSAYGQDEWTKVVEAAKKEGSVVYYTALGGPHEDEPLKRFEQRYGIRVTKLVGRASEMRERALADHRAGKPTADLYVVTQPTVPGVISEGVVDAKVQVPNMANLLPSVTSSAASVPISITPYGILINTRLVPPAEEPKSWKDLLNPKWAGKMLADDLRVPGAGQAFFEPTYKAFGREFHEKLAAQKAVITRGNREGEMQVARGEYAMIYPQILPYALRLKGLPAKFLIPEEGATYAQPEFALIKGAPHPNAARLLVNFFLEDETQLAFANSGVRPVVKGVVEKANDDVRQYLTAKLLGSSTAEGQPPALKIAAEIYK